MKTALKILTAIFITFIAFYVFLLMTPVGLFTTEMFKIGTQFGEEQGAGAQYAKTLDVNFSEEKLYHIKEAEYCGDNDCCTENCSVGYFYVNSDYSIKKAMEELGLGKFAGLKYLKPKYDGSGAEYILTGSQKFADGVIIEYKITGVC